jgi:uncharacterized lipoprotein YmbA
MWTMILACMAAGCAEGPHAALLHVVHSARGDTARAQPIPVTIVVEDLNAPALLRDDRVVYAMSDCGTCVVTNITAGRNHRQE